jgi:hypothetical protein
MFVHTYRAIPYQSRLLLRLAPDSTLPLLGASPALGDAGNMVAPPGDLGEGPPFRFPRRKEAVIDSWPSNGFTEYPENAIEFGPTGTSGGFLKCLGFVPGPRKVGPGIVTDGGRMIGPRIVASDVFLGGPSDCNVAMFNIPSMSNDCRDSRGSGDCDTCAMPFEGEGVEFTRYLWSSGTAWAQDAMLPLP